MRTAQEIMKRIQQVVEHLVAIALGVMITVVFLQTVFRYVIQASLPWSEELSRFLFVFLIAIGMNVGITKDIQVSIDFVDTRLGPKGIRIMDIFRQCIGIIMNIFFMVSSVELLQVGSRQVSPALGLPMSVMYAVLLIGFALAALAALMRLLMLVFPQTEEVAD